MWIKSNFINYKPFIDISYTRTKWEQGLVLNFCYVDLLFKFLLCQFNINEAHDMSYIFKYYKDQFIPLLNLILY